MCRRKSSAMQSIEVLCASQNLEAGTLTAKAKLLLGSYRRVCWATLGSCTLDTDDRYCVRHEGPEIALEYLRTYTVTQVQTHHVVAQKVRRQDGSRIPSDQRSLEIQCGS